MESAKKFLNRDYIILSISQKAWSTWDCSVLRPSVLVGAPQNSELYNEFDLKDAKVYVSKEISAQNIFISTANFFGVENLIATFN